MKYVWFLILEEVCVFTNFEQILRIVLVFLLLAVNK